MLLFTQCVCYFKNLSWDEGIFQRMICCNKIRSLQSCNNFAFHLLRKVFAIPWCLNYFLATVLLANQRLKKFRKELVQKRESVRMSITRSEITLISKQCIQTDEKEAAFWCSVAWGVRKFQKPTGRRTVNRQLVFRMMKKFDRCHCLQLINWLAQKMALWMIQLNQLCKCDKSNIRRSKSKSQGKRTDSKNFSYITYL